MNTPELKRATGCRGILVKFRTLLIGFKIRTHSYAVIRLKVDNSEDEREITKNGSSSSDAKQ